MPAPLYALFRFVMVFIGLLCAALAAGLTLTLGETAGLIAPPDVSEAQAREGLLVNGLVISGYALAMGFIPAFAAGLIAELFRWRSILYYAIIGGLIGLYIHFEPVPAWINVTQEEGVRLIRDSARAYPAAGIVAGAMYWLLTGCRAGFSRAPFAPKAASRR